MEDGKTHLEHRWAQRDHAEWLRDISLWRVDHQKALSILALVESRIHDMGASMEAHAAAIRFHHLEITQHEAAIAEGNGAAYESRHREMDAMHDDVKDHHASLGEEHSELMGDLGALFEMLQDNG